MLSILYEILIKPISKDEDTQRKEMILNSIICGIIVLMVLLDISVAYNIVCLGKLYAGVSFQSFTLFLMAVIFLLFLSRKGYYTVSSYIIIALIFAGTTYSSYIWGISLPAGLLSYAFIILISAILISKRFGFLVSILIISILYTLAYRESLDYFIPRWHGRAVKVSDAIQYSVMLIFITTLAYIYSKDIERSLNRARRSEQKLKEEKDLLEIRVSERTEELKKAQLEKAAQLNHFAEFGKLSSGLFHDLVGPLFTVALNIESLNSSLHPDLPSIKDHVQLSLKASKKMERFIIAVKRQIQQNDMREYFSLNSIIEDVMILLHYKSLKEHVYLNFYAIEEIFTHNNPLKFHQIVYNLVNNAIESYIDTIIESVGANLDSIREKSVDITLTRKSDMVILEVDDYGSGITKENINRIFDPFFSTKVNRGIGLGLGNVKLAVNDDFSGKIEVASEVNKGSTFTVTFPITQK